jgi:Prokaryotic E2 family E
VNALLAPLESQLLALRADFPGTAAEVLPDGTVAVTVPSVPLPVGWSAANATLEFLVPVGFPVALPDCFWANADLRLEGGALPASSSFNPMPGKNEPRLWFSWHVQPQAWNPSTSTLSTYVRVIRERLARAN